jgi:hypothetical protein
MSTTPRKKAAATAAAGLTEAEVRERMLVKLQSSGLTAKDAVAMRLVPLTKAGAAKLKLPSVNECFVIPYFDLKGRPTKFWRARFVVDTRKGFDVLAGRKALRYVQPANSVTEAYLPPLGVDWTAIARNADEPLVITEGELKAACAVRHGFRTIGLGGVWSFQSTKHNTALLPIFHEFALSGRMVYICFDSDAATNPNVVAAERRLAERLLECGAVVHVVRLKPGKSGQKMGLDDFIVEYGPGDFQTLLDTAQEYEGSEVLHELNECVVYVRNPGLVWDHRLGTRMSPSGFVQHHYSDWVYTERVKGAKSDRLVEVRAAEKWLKWPARAAVDGLSFAPGQDRITQDNKLNLWTGWGVPDGPMEGDVSPWHHLLDHLFQDEHEARQWFERWCAYPLQYPGAKMATAAVLWGVVHGSGKTLVGHTLMRIYGKHATEINDDALDDERREWAENMQFVLADDITARGDRRFMRRLMTMITQKLLRLNPKYVPSYTVEDVINYYFTSNEPDAIYMDDQDRRFFVHEVRAGKYKDYKDYVAWRDSVSGIAALWYYLLHLDLGDFDPQAPAPMTTAKSTMIELGKSELGAWVRELRDNADAVLDKYKLQGDLFSAQELYALYDSAGDKRASVNALARELKRAGLPTAGGPDSKIKRPDGSTLRVYAVRNIDKWLKASWKEACEHYAHTHPQLIKRSGGKF